MEKGESKNVYKIYDKIAGWFSQNRPEVLVERHYLDYLTKHLPVGSTVLDLGCGTGKPILQFLIQSGFHVTGVDASQKILEIAKKNFPATELILADMRSLDLKKKFDAIIAWHSFFHLPASDQPKMFDTFEKHLNPGGFLLFTSGTTRGEVWGMNGGENLFHASLDKAEYQHWLDEHHFNILKYTENDVDCGGANVWLAQQLM
jgi:cyclopropane fatty-acyl-phospholipid synthase-like methyltransferase